MNEKQFKNMLAAYDEDLENRSGLYYNQKEVLTTFLKRLLRANAHQELNVKKVSDIETIFNARQVKFIEKRTGTVFKVIIDYDLKEVSLLY